MLEAAGRAGEKDAEKDRWKEGWVTHRGGKQAFCSSVFLSPAGALVTKLAKGRLTREEQRYLLMCAQLGDTWGAPSAEAPEGQSGLGPG